MSEKMTKERGEKNHKIQFEEVSFLLLQLNFDFCCSGLCGQHASCLTSLVLIPVLQS